jgi:hypothetical protein
MSDLPTRTDISTANEIRQRLRERKSISVLELMFLKKVERRLKLSTAKQRRLDQWKRLLSADCS